MQFDLIIDGDSLDIFVNFPSVLFKDNYLLLFKFASIYHFVPRWSDGPRVNGVEPILVIFDDPKEKEIVWSKLRDNLQVTLTSLN